MIWTTGPMRLSDLILSVHLSILLNLSLSLLHTIYLSVCVSICTGVNIVNVVFYSHCVSWCFYTLPVSSSLFQLSVLSVFSLLFLSPSASLSLLLYLSLSLPETADGDYGPVLPFVLFPRETCGFLDSTQLSSPYLIQNAGSFLFITNRGKLWNAHILNTFIKTSLNKGHLNTLNEHDFR